MTRFLTIRRNKSDNKAIGYTWCRENQTKEEIQKLIDEWNAKYSREYYEFCENEDLINLLPAPRRRYDCEDIVNSINNFTTEVEEMSDTLDGIKDLCRDISERCQKLGAYGDD